MTSSNISPTHTKQTAQDPRWRDNFSIIGHRGAAGIAPENTLESFKRAVELGVTAIELDLYVHSGELIVIHDDRLDRTTNGKGPLSNCSLNDLRSLDAGNGNTIPFLHEVVRIIPPPVAINLELKGPSTAAAVAKWLQAETPTNPIIVSSFDLAELSRFRAADTVTAVAPLFHKRNADMLSIAADLGASSINLSTRLASASRLHRIRSAGFGALVYTVNSLRSAKRLLRDGATGVFTDRPDRISSTSVHERQDC